MSTDLEVRIAAMERELAELKARSAMANAGLAAGIDQLNALIRTKGDVDYYALEKRCEKEFGSKPVMVRSDVLDLLKDTVYLMRAPDGSYIFIDVGEEIEFSILTRDQLAALGRDLVAIAGGPQ